MTEIEDTNWQRKAQLGVVVELLLRAVTRYALSRLFTRKVGQGPQTRLWPSTKFRHSSIYGSC